MPGVPFEDLQRRAVQPGAGEQGRQRVVLDDVVIAMREYEQQLADRLITGLVRRPEITIWGITDPRRKDERAGHCR